VVVFEETRRQAGIGMHELLLRIYEQLLEAFGPQNWWPGDSTEEIIIGAILTQNTNWKNVERAIANLKSADRLSFSKISAVSESRLGRLIKPSGYFRIKARRLIATAELFTKNSRDNHRYWRKGDIQKLRQKLLDTYGIGKETADSILLYAFERPTFVVDAYTVRIAERHGLCKAEDDYDAVKRIYESGLPRRVNLYNEYHALLVRLGKTYCKPKPLCYECPLMGGEFFATRRAFQTQKRIKPEGRAK
jgi:endonuclease-3 related protein